MPNTEKEFACLDKEIEVGIPAVFPMQKRNLFICIRGMKSTLREGYFIEWR